MFGFVFGALCLVGLVKVWRHRHWGGWRHRGHFGGHRRWLVYRAFEELDASPAQEKVLRQALADLRRSFEELRPGLDALRGSVATALRGDTFDSAALQSAFERQTAELGQRGSAVATALAKAHDALDPDQRRRLARLVELGPSF